MRSKLLDGSTGTYVLVFESGDSVMDLLTEFARERSIRAGHFTAIGAFAEAELGYFDFSIKDYKKTVVKEQVEVLSMQGDIALYGDEPKIHAHVVLGRSDTSAIGGHLLKATARPTLEVILEVSPSYLQRRIDKDTNLPLIVID